MKNDRQNYVFVCLNLYIFGWQIESQNTLHRMITNIPCFQSDHVEFWSVRVVPKYLNSFALSEDLLRTFMLWFRPACWSWDVAICLVFSAFISRPVTLLLTTKASVLFFAACVIPPNILTSSTKPRSCCVPFHFKPTWFAWTWKAMAINHLLLSNHSS